MTETTPHFHALGLSGTLGLRDVRATHIDGADVVVWRQESGRTHVWRNQCPHRGMRLSYGCVRDDKLACIYHGWRFDQDGRCAYVPAQPDFKPSSRVGATTYQCVESQGFIWALESADELPDLVGEANAGHPFVDIRSISVDASIDQVHSGLNDAAFDPWSNDADRADEFAHWWLARDVILISTPDGDERVLVAAQVVSEAQCVLHVQASAARTEAAVPKFRSHHHAWLKRFRSSLESGARLANIEGQANG